MKKTKGNYLLKACMLVLFLSVMVLPGKKASADDGWGSCGTGVNWHFYEATGNLEITGTGEMTSAPWGDYASKITSVTIGEGVTSVCGSAFSSNYNTSYSNLKTVTLSSTVNRIGEKAFYGLSGLTTITLPEALQKIEKNAFAGTGLTSITIPASVTELYYGAFSGCTSLSSVTLTASDPYLPGACFYECTSLKSIVIPEGITGIGSECFAGSGITGIQIPSTVTELGYKAFSDCDSLQAIEIPASVTVLRDISGYDCTWDDYDTSYLCYSCDNLQYVIYNAQHGIPKYTFKECPKLQAVMIGEGVPWIDGGNFNGDAFIAAFIPQSVTEISGDSFDSSHIMTFYSYANTKAWSFAGADANINFVDVSTEAGMAQWNTVWTAATTLPVLNPTTTAAPTATASPSVNTQTKVKVGKVKKLKVKTKKKSTYKLYKISWKKVSGATGYEVYWSRKKKGKYTKISSNAYTNKARCRGIPKNKKFYIKVRAYKTVNGVAHYGKFSKVVRK